MSSLVGQRTRTENPAPIPRFRYATIEGVGIGLRHQHFSNILREKPVINWLEVHSENFFKSGSQACSILEEIRQDYPLSAHGVGLSLGSADGLDANHIAQLETFIARFEPTFISEHISWSAAKGIHIPDLLPLPYTEEALEIIVRNISQLQDRLGRKIAVENPSSYLSFTHSTMNEAEFVAEVAKQADCGLLLDVNNVFVSAHNHGFDAHEYLDALPGDRITEIHLAGFTIEALDNRDIYIDTHSAPVHEPVWVLFEEAVKRFGDIPTLIEWDSDVPPLPRLLEEAETAKHKRETLLGAS